MIFLKLRGQLENMGYVDMTFEFPKDVVGVAINIPTLLLVLPDVHSEKSCFSLDKLYPASGNGIHHSQLSGYCAVLKTLALRHQQNKEGRVGLVRMFSRTLTLIHAGHSVILVGSAKVCCRAVDCWAVVEHPSQSCLPGGLCIKSCFITLPCYTPYKVPVMVTNTSQQDVSIPPLGVIASLEVSTALFHNTV